MENKKVFIEIKTDGEVKLREVTPEDDTLEVLQNIVDGHIEVLPTVLRGVFLVVNDEGALEGRPDNALAAVLVDVSHIMGDAALTIESVDDEGERDLAPMNSNFAKLVMDAAGLAFLRALFG